MARAVQQQRVALPSNVEPLPSGLEVEGAVLFRENADGVIGVVVAQDVVLVSGPVDAPGRRESPGRMRVRVARQRAGDTRTFGQDGGSGGGQRLRMVAEEAGFQLRGQERLVRGDRPQQAEIRLHPCHFVVRERGQQPLRGGSAISVPGYANGRLHLVQAGRPAAKAEIVDLHLKMVLHGCIGQRRPVMAPPASRRLSHPIG